MIADISLAFLQEGIDFDDLLGEYGTDTEINHS